MKDCIIIVLSKNTSFLVVEESPLAFVYDGHCFIGKFKTDNNGFFDWLRGKSNKIVGVRWSAYDEEDARLVAEKLASLSNVKVDDSGSICIYFDSLYDFDESISCDQDFGENNFYITTTGLCAMSFSAANIESLDELEGARGFISEI